MAGEVRYFGRQYALQIGDAYFSVKPGKPAMDIKFDVSYARGQTAREGTISILGLGWEKIHTFIDLSAKARGEALSEQIPVSLWAGYFSDAGMVNVINGYAYYATVTSPPQMWLNIKVSEYNVMGGKSTDLENITNEPIKSAVEKVLTKFSEIEGVDFLLMDKTEDQLLSTNELTGSVEFKGKYTIGTAIAKMSECLCDKVYFILRTDTEETNVRHVEALDKNLAKACPGEPAIVDSAHGLLSVTGIDVVQGTVTTFLDDSIPDELCHLQLKSELNPQANGIYYITRKQYVGHYMGNEWYVKYTCSGKEKDD